MSAAGPEDTGAGSAPDGGAGAAGAGGAGGAAGARAAPPHAGLPRAASPAAAGDGAPAAPTTIAEAARALRAGEVTSAALLRAALTRADALDASLGVYVARFDEPAAEAAARADAELAAGLDRGPLHGIPVGVKDVFATTEGPTTCGSRVLDPA